MKQLYLFILVLGISPIYLAAQDSSWKRQQQSQKTNPNETISDTIISMPDGSTFRYFTYSISSGNDNDGLVNLSSSPARKGFEQTQEKISRQVGEDVNKLNAWRIQRDEYVRQYLKQQKEALFVEVMGLTLDESKRFWPLYNEYSKKKDAISEKRREINNLLRYANLYNISEKEAETLAKQHIDLLVQETNLQQEYYRKYKIVLKPSKVVLIYKAEDAFKILMLQTRGQVIE